MKNEGEEWLVCGSKLKKSRHVLTKETQRLDAKHRLRAIS